MIKSALKRLSHGTFELTVTIPKEDIKKAYEAVVVEMVKNAELTGFRKGAAPRERVEPTLDKKKIYDELVRHVVPNSYVEAVEKQGLKPVLNPRVQLTAAKDGEDWVFTAVSCEAPEVSLGDYKAEAKKAVAVDKLWVPGKGAPADQKEEASREQKLNKIVDHLLGVIAIEPSELLVEEEVNHSLSRLVDQTQQLGITVEQYLASSGKTAEKLREEYSQAAKRSLQLEFLLNAVAQDLKIQVTDKEIDELVASAPDETSRQTLNRPGQRAMLQAIFARRRALDTLLGFA